MNKVWLALETLNRRYVYRNTDYRIKYHIFLNISNLPLLPIKFCIPRLCIYHMIFLTYHSEVKKKTHTLSLKCGQHSPNTVFKRRQSVYDRVHRQFQHFARIFDIYCRSRYLSIRHIDPYFKISKTHRKPF